MITYINGDATQPLSPGNKVIVHICNDIGAWGRGFVLSLSHNHTKAEYEYKKWHQQISPWNQKPFRLGETQFVQTKEEVWVANMIAQQGIMMKNGVPPIRYDALRTCLQSVGFNAPKIDASIHMPRIGCGLAGGKWSIIEDLINEELCDRALPVFVYDFETNDSRTIPWNK